MQRIRTKLQVIQEGEVQKVSNAAFHLYKYAQALSALYVSNQGLSVQSPLVSPEKDEPSSATDTSPTKKRKSRKERNKDSPESKPPADDAVRSAPRDGAEADDC